MIEYEVVKSDTMMDEWVVEGIDYDSEGEIYATIFSGPKAEERAKEYAEYLNRM